MGRVTRTGILRAAGYVGTGLLGVPPAFFMVLNALFTDAGGPADHVLALAVTVAAYLVLGAVASLLIRGAPRAAALALAGPGVLIAILYTLREPGVWPLAVVQAAGAVAAAFTGAALGARARASLGRPRDRA